MREYTSQYADLGSCPRFRGASFVSRSGLTGCFTWLSWGRECKGISKGIPYDDAQHPDAFATIHDLSEPSGRNLGKMKNGECWGE